MYIKYIKYCILDNERGIYILNNIISDDRGDNILYFNIGDREKIRDVTKKGKEKDEFT